MLTRKTQANKLYNCSTEKIKCNISNFWSEKLSFFRNFEFLIYSFSFIRTLCWSTNSSCSRDLLRKRRIHVSCPLARINLGKKCYFTVSINILISVRTQHIVKNAYYFFNLWSLEKHLFQISKFCDKRHLPFVTNFVPIDDQHNLNSYIKCRFVLCEVFVFLHSLPK